MRVLIGCEESQAVCIEFRKLGHEAFSCDTQESSGGHPKWHIKGDVLEVMNQGWDMGIFFPPCTHLACSGAMHFEKKRKDGRQQEGIDFFMSIINAPIEKLAVENPVGIMSSKFRTPDQKIQPYYFGDEFQKTTCLWLKNLPPLYHNDKPNLFDQEVTHVGKGEFVYWTDKNGKQKRMPEWYSKASGDSGTRSKTFPGIAKAMAQQWGNYE